MKYLLLINCLIITGQLYGITVIDCSGKKRNLGQEKAAKQSPEQIEQPLHNPHMPQMVRPKEPRALIAQAFHGQPVNTIFSTIYEQNFWLGNESLSGQGSSLRATKHIRKELSVLLDDLKIKSLLDAGCGDGYWMQLMDTKRFMYIGIDIVPSLIDKNRSHYGDKQHLFLCANLIEDPLPCVDLILCRDVLAHLDYQNACNMLRNFQKSGSTFLCATTHRHDRENNDIHAGEHYPYDLTKAPFNLPEPLLIIQEASAEECARNDGKMLGLWLLQDIDMSCLAY